MFVSCFVRKHINDLPPNMIFTTREILSLGSRSAIDSALSRLVKSERVVRLARGVFIKAGSELPPPIEIARAKAKAFGKSLMRHCCDVARELQLCNKNHDGQITFAVNGRTSAFDAVNGRINLKGVGPRKMHLGDCSVGKALRSLWHIGDTSAKNIAKATMSFNRHDRIRFDKAAAWVPARIRIPIWERWRPKD